MHRHIVEFNVEIKKVYLKKVEVYVSREHPLTTQEIIDLARSELQVHLTDDIENCPSIREISSEVVKENFLRMRDAGKANIWSVDRDTNGEQIVCASLKDLEEFVNSKNRSVCEETKDLWFSLRRLCLRQENEEM